VTESEVSVGAWVAFAELAGPVLASMLVIGLFAGFLQTITQLRESSLASVLKLAGVAVLTTTAGPFMMRGVEQYATNLINAIPGMVHG